MMDSSNFCLTKPLESLHHLPSPLLDLLLMDVIVKIVVSDIPPPAVIITIVSNYTRISD